MICPESGVRPPSEIGEITLKGFRVIEKDAGKPWVGFPQETYQKDGEWKNIPIVEVSPRTKRIISDSILENYRRIALVSSDPIPSRPQKA
ncbi:MAG: hypothetical protein PHD76_05720 [Methylacidiphilales bacterium]|nr:hypothetical protein [Candidatus Methylacidiphilales bacterium]